MSFDNFEDYSKKKMSDHASDLDTDAFWDVLEPQLEKPKKKRPIILLVFMLGLAFGLSALVFNSLKTNGLESIDVIEKNEISKKTKEVSTVETESNSTDNSELKKSNLESSKPVDFTEKSVTADASSVIEKRVSKNDFNLKTANEISEKANLLNLQDSSNSNNLDLLNSENLANQGNNRSLKVGSNILKNEGLALPENSTQTDFLEIKSVEIREEVAPILPLAFLPFEFEKSKLSPDELPKIEVLKSSKNWQIFVGANFGYAKPIRKMTAQTPEAAPFLQKRTFSETVLELLSTGIDIEFKNQKNWSILAGISGNQLTERFDFETRYSGTETIFGEVNEIIYRENGDILANIGDLNQDVNFYEFRKVYNTIQWLEVSTGIGYNRTFGRAEIGIAGGALFGFGLRTNGFILDESEGYLDLKTNGNLAYKSTPGLGLFSKFKFQYQLSSKLAIASEFELKNYLNSFTRSDYPIELKYQFTGVKLGVNYRL